MRLGTSVSLPLEIVIWLKNNPQRASDIIEYALEQMYSISTILLAIEKPEVYTPIEAHLREFNIPFTNLCTFDGQEDMQYSYVSMVNSCNYVIFHLTSNNGGLELLSKLETASPDKIVILAENLTESQIMELVHKNYQWFYSIDDVIYFIKSRIKLPKR